MCSKRIFGKTVSDEQAAEQTNDGACPECDGEVVSERREAVCSGCGLAVEERLVDLDPRFQLRNVEKEEDKRGLETETPYFVDPNGSPYEIPPLGVTFPSGRGNWTSDGKDNWVSDKTQDKWSAIKHRQVRRESNSRDNWRTDALQDIKTIGCNSGVPRYVRERATGRVPEPSVDEPDNTVARTDTRSATTTGSAPEQRTHVLTGDVAECWR